MRLSTRRADRNVHSVIMEYRIPYPLQAFIEQENALFSIPYFDV